jgi:hypothetical protein
MTSSARLLVMLMSWNGSRYSVAWQYAGKEFWVRDHGPAVEIHYSTKRIRDLRGAQARTLRQSLLHRDLSG